MAVNIFLPLLILCGIWSQGIIETFADEEIKEFSDYHVRQKRVVSYVPGEDKAVSINTAPYVVQIKEYLRIKCVGSILSPYVVITSAGCIVAEPHFYKIVYATNRLSDGYMKSVVEIRKRMDNARHLDGVGLLIVDESFKYNPYCQPIGLYTGPLAPGSLAEVLGWGYNYRNDIRGTNFPTKLRLIVVPIISHQACVNTYQRHLQITEKDVCTYHSEQHSGHLDYGAGLVIGGHLAGVFLWSGLNGKYDPSYPDVFLSLQDPHYNHWIRVNLRSIDLHFQNHPHH